MTFFPLAQWLKPVSHMPAHRFTRPTWNLINTGRCSQQMPIRQSYTCRLSANNTQHLNYCIAGDTDRYYFWILLIDCDGNFSQSETITLQISVTVSQKTRDILNRFTANKLYRTKIQTVCCLQFLKSMAGFHLFGSKSREKEWQIQKDTRFTGMRGPEI